MIRLRIVNAILLGIVAFLVVFAILGLLATRAILRPVRED